MNFSQKYRCDKGNIILIYTKLSFDRATTLIFMTKESEREIRAKYGVVFQSYHWCIKYHWCMKFEICREQSEKSREDQTITSRFIRKAV